MWAYKVVESGIDMWDPDKTRGYFLKREKAEKFIKDRNLEYYCKIHRIRIIE